MISTSTRLCDCCGLVVTMLTNDDCPRCGYPINALKEQRFLEAAVRDLERVAAHGGGKMAVGLLIQRYRMRLNYLYQLAAQALPQAPLAQKPQLSVTAVPTVLPPSSLPAITKPLPLTLLDASELPAAEPPALEAIPAIIPSAPAEPIVAGQAFSLKTFFADQTINIVGSLGAFLILVGSLSFIATTTNLLWSFLVMFLLHAIFGVAGVVSYRFRSFRTVAAIYTAIFALLVPLVGFSAYRLIAGQVITLSTPTLIAIAAAYAALVYGALTIYQRFQPFGYMAVTALVVANLATAFSFNLGYWWLPVALMLLALPALVSVSSKQQVPWPFQGPGTILRLPVLVMMTACTLVGCIFLLYLFLYTLAPVVGIRSQYEMRFAILCLSLLILLWSVLFLWRSKRTNETMLLPYLFLGCVLAFCYAYQYQPVGYVVALTLVAALYHVLVRKQASIPPSLNGVCKHLNGLSLLLVALLPFIATPFTPIEIVEKAYNPYYSFLSPLTRETITCLLALLVGSAVVVSSCVYTVSTSVAADKTARRWFLLLSGFLLSWAWAMATLQLRVSPLWSFFVLTLVYVTCAVALRRFIDARWANPVDVLALNTSVVTILLCFNHNSSIIIALFDFFAVLSYSMALYQGRHRLLSLPLAFFLCTLFLFSTHLFVTLLTSLLLPLLAVIVHRSYAVHRLSGAGVLAQSSERIIIWEWPLLVGALVYSIAFFNVDVLSPVSTVQHWLGIPFPVALELGLAAFVWYAAAALAREKMWLFIATPFACVALVLPANAATMLAWVAPSLILCGFLVKRLSSLAWSIPFYVAGTLAALMMGIDGYAQGQVLLATNALLLFAVVLYLVGVSENLIAGHEKREALLFRWLAASFATWSVCNTALIGNLYRAPVLALVCAALGVAIGCFRYVLPQLRSATRNPLLRYSLPLYTTAMAAAIWTALYGTFVNVDAPFPTASPDLLLVFTLIAFGVILFERQPRCLFLVAAFGIWATCLAVGVNFYYVTCLGVVAALLGFLSSRFIRIPFLPSEGANVAAIGYPLYKFSWGWPWYAMALVAAGSLGAWRFLPALPVPLAISEYALLGFAVIAYAIGIAEEMLAWSWVGTLLATWSLFYSAQSGDGYRLFSIALICTTVGVLTQVLNRSNPSLFVMTQRNRRVEYALPFYATAIAAALLTGTFSGNIGINTPFYAALPCAMLMYALIAYEVVLLERQPKWLVLVAVLSVWGTLLAMQTALVYVVAIGLCAGVIGLLLSRIVHQPGITTTYAAMLIKFSWGWPWYGTVLVAACLTGLWNMLALSHASMSMIENSLLAFAALIYIIGLVERMPSWARLAVVLSAWSLYDTIVENDFYRLFALALLGGLAGVVLNYADRWAQRPRFAGYRLPLYIISLIAALLVGVYGTAHGLVTLPFYASVPIALLIYALLVYAIALVERRGFVQWSVVGFAVWATLLLTVAPACPLFINTVGSHACQVQRQTDALLLAGAALSMGILGILTGLLYKFSLHTETKSALAGIKSSFSWSWSWYTAALFAIVVSAVWNILVAATLPASLFYGVFYAFIALTLLIVLIERVPEIVLVPLGLSVVTISQLHWLFWQQAVAYSLLFALVFASRAVWNVLTPRGYVFSPRAFHERISLFGQACVVLLVMLHGGLIQTGMVAHVGAFALLLLAIFLLWHGQAQTQQLFRRWCYYAAGLLISLSASWELAALQQTRIDVLTLAPATYLVVIAPFLARDTTIKNHNVLGQLCSIVGAVLLLLPTLWSSFTQDNLQPTLILAAESLALFIVGVSTRIRIFILSGAALVIVSAIHALFLPSLGIPPFLALAMLGVALLALATALKVMSSRIKQVWKEAE